MPRTKIKLSKEDVEAYKKNPSLEMLATRCNINIKTAKLRLEEMGIITAGEKKGKCYRRVFSKEFLENRKMNTLVNNNHFKRNNIEGKKHHPSVLQAIGYRKI